MCDHLKNGLQYIEQNCHGVNVFKDQCTECFIDPTTDVVQICLKCFNGGCKTNNHSKSHYELTGHQLSLGLRLVKKVNIDHNDQKIIKDEKIDYQQLLQLNCNQCGIEMDFQLDDNSELNGQYNEVVSRILKKESFFKAQEITGFELEINPCEHTLTIVQENDKKIENKNMAKCMDCELNSNLWLCLICGNLGCGRKYYDGSGGNNHAVDHATNTQHSLAVKLGTITADGSASVYCYTCNDDVKDNYLTEHMANFGIQISGLEKTEKTQVELNMEANKNIFLSKEFEQDRNFNYKYQEDGQYTGLDNIGNSCYINSVVQLLFNISEIRDKYINLEFKTNQPGNNLISQTIKLVQGMFNIQKYKFSPKVEVKSENGELVDVYQEGLKLNNFKNIVAKDNMEFISNRQQDAQEYLLYLIDQIEKQEKNNGVGNSCQLFSNQMYEQIVCQQCGKYKLNTNVSQIYMTNIGNNDDKFGDLIGRNQESIDDKLDCFKCKSKQQFIKVRGITGFNRYLWVSVSRMSYENWVPAKTMGNILFDYVDSNKVIYDFAYLKNDLDVLQNNQFTADDVDQTKLSILISMGIDDKLAIKALIECNNSVEQSFEWIEKQQNQSNQSANNVNQEYVAQIISLLAVQNTKIAEFALLQNNNNLDQALNYIFENGTEQIEEMMLIQEAQQQSQQPAQNYQDNFGNPDKNNSKYELIGAIIHLGTSILCGHYVCYIRRNDEWLYCNDDKVAVVQNPSIEKATLLLFRQI